MPQAAPQRDRFARNEKEREADHGQTRDDQHTYDEKRNALCFHCAQGGRKVDVLQKDNRIWGQALVDLGYAEGRCDHLYATTQFRGRVTFVEDLEEKRHALHAQCALGLCDRA